MGSTRMFCDSRWVSMAPRPPSPQQDLEDQYLCPIDWQLSRACPIESSHKHCLNEWMDTTMGEVPRHSHEEVTNAYFYNAGSIPGSGRSPRGGNGNPLQYSCLENPMERNLEGYSP